MQKNRRRTTGHYADYEFLYTRHSKYFSSLAEVKAVVELVLSKPERVQGINKNISFVGRDEATGKIYRIEIDPTVKNKANHIRSVFEITSAQYEKIKLAELPVLQPSPTEGIKHSAAITSANFTKENSTDSSEFKLALSDYSESDHSDLIKVIKPFVGRNIT